MKNPFNEDDYFKSSTMSFGDHLEELRKVVIHSIYGLAVCMILGFFAAPYVVKVFKAPIERALQNFYHERAVAELKARHNHRLPLELSNLIEFSELVPEYDDVDVSELIQNLQSVYPGQFDGIVFSPYTFVPDDFQAHELTILSGIETARTLVPTASRFAARLAEEGSADGATPGKRLWELLTPAEREFVEEVGTTGEAEITFRDRQRLALLLNRIVMNQSLHDDPAFADVKGSGQAADTILELRSALGQAGTTPTEERSSAESPGGTSAVQVQRLNKLLITSHFSNELRPSQLALVKLPVWKTAQRRVQSLNAQEAFMIWLKASFITGLVLAGPWIFYQIWTFVAAGLYPHEKNYVYWYLPISLLLFVAGAALAFLFVMDQVLNFLFYFNAWLEIDPDPRIGEWLSFVLVLPLGFGISFQLPLVMLFLNRIGLASLDFYYNQWRIAIVIIAVVSMLLTPADPYSMLMMMIPLVFLYFLGIAMCKWMPRGRSVFFDEAYEP